MKTSQEGIELIKHFEGLRLSTYKCSAGVDTIGYGSTGAHVKPDMTITEDEAEALLVQDLSRFEEGVANLAPKTTQSQFDALVSFAFNLGLGNLKASTLLRLHNQGQYKLAAAQFVRWNRASGKVLSGLTRRREAEAKLYQSC